MRTRRGFERGLVIGFTVLMALSSILVDNAVAASGGLNLPSTSVFIEVSNGTESYFNTKLSNVSSGYDVVNGTYLGWCVDVRTSMARSPVTHEVRLFSSSNPPVELANQKWDLVNYILNHKQGEAADVQQAISFFICMDGNYTPTRAVAKTIVNDTLANGKWFVPGDSQTIAVICYPLIFSHQSAVQISIIEVAEPIIPEFPSFLIFPLFMSLTLLAALVYMRKHRKR
jgi:hypothetical protein